jgi:uncharacterized protein (TIGR02453 family)
MDTPGHFTPDTFAFLRTLAKNNDRDWFKANKGRFEDEVKEPAIRFILDFAPHLKGISPHFRADPRANGGSLFRIYRDTRFTKDKRPFKTHTGIQFRHDQGKDAHAPGFYLHLEPKGCFVAVGIWRPDSETLRRIREGLVNHVQGWRKAVEARAFRDRFQLSGDVLSRPPRGFDPLHPLVEDLKRKDFIAVAPLSESAVVDPAFLHEFVGICRAGRPLVSFLCKALEVPF